METVRISKDLWTQVQRCLHLMTTVFSHLHCERVEGSVCLPTKSSLKQTLFSNSTKLRTNVPRGAVLEKLFVRSKGSSSPGIELLSRQNLLHGTTNRTSVDDSLDESLSYEKDNLGTLHNNSSTSTTEQSSRRNTIATQKNVDGWKSRSNHFLTFSPFQPKRPVSYQSYNSGFQASSQPWPDYTISRRRYRLVKRLHGSSTGQFDKQDKRHVTQDKHSFDIMKTKKQCIKNKHSLDKLVSDSDSNDEDNTKQTTINDACKQTQHMNNEHSFDQCLSDSDDAEKASQRTGVNGCKRSQCWSSPELDDVILVEAQPSRRFHEQRCAIVVPDTSMRVLSHDDILQSRHHKDGVNLSLSVPKTVSLAQVESDTISGNNRNDYTANVYPSLPKTIYPAGLRPMSVSISSKHVTSTPTLTLLAKNEDKTNLSMTKNSERKRSVNSHQVSSASLSQHVNFAVKNSGCCQPSGRLCSKNRRKFGSIVDSTKSPPATNHGGGKPSSSSNCTIESKKTSDKQEISSARDKQQPSPQRSTVSCNSESSSDVLRARDGQQVNKKQLNTLYAQGLKSSSFMRSSCNKRKSKDASIKKVSRHNLDTFTTPSDNYQQRSHLRNGCEKFHPYATSQKFENSRCISLQRANMKSPSLMSPLRDVWIKSQEDRKWTTLDRSPMAQVTPHFATTRKNSCFKSRRLNYIEEDATTMELPLDPNENELWSNCSSGKCEKTFCFNCCMDLS